MPFLLLVDQFYISKWIIFTLVATQMEKRQMERFSRLEISLQNLNSLEREFLTFKAELPIQYVRREDYVRGQTVIEAKLDALYSKLEAVQHDKFEKDN
ncbi:hypothetical protein CBG25_00930 [Arsenophonus sp. ENCA]|nr:hypothetical protein CBG25_00930 [Arsenophonus sp. ENCA]